MNEEPGEIRIGPPQSLLRASQRPHCPVVEAILYHATQPVIRSRRIVSSYWLIGLPELPSLEQEWQRQGIPSHDQATSRRGACSNDCKTRCLFTSLLARSMLFLPPSPAARPEQSQMTKKPLHQRAPRPAVVRPSAPTLPPPCHIFLLNPAFLARRPPRKLKGNHGTLAPARSAPRRRT